MTAYRHKGKFIPASSPLAVAQAAREAETKRKALEAQLAYQQERINARLAAMEQVKPSRERRNQARAHGYRGPLTRSELARMANASLTVSLT